MGLKALVAGEVLRGQALDLREEVLPVVVVVKVGAVGKVDW